MSGRSGKRSFNLYFSLYFIFFHMIWTCLVSISYFLQKKKKAQSRRLARHAHISCASVSLFLGSYQQDKALSPGRALTPACQALLMFFLQSITSCLSSRFPVAGQLELLQKDKQEGHSYQCRLSCQPCGQQNIFFFLDLKMLRKTSCC